MYITYGVSIEIHVGMYIEVSYIKYVCKVRLFQGLLRGLCTGSRICTRFYAKSSRTNSLLSVLYEIFERAYKTLQESAKNQNIRSNQQD